MIYTIPGWDIRLCP